MSDVVILFETVREVLDAWPDAGLLDLVAAILPAVELDDDEEGLVRWVVPGGLPARARSFAALHRQLNEERLACACGADGHRFSRQLPVIPSCYLCDEDLKPEIESLFSTVRSAYDSLHAGECSPF